MKAVKEDQTIDAVADPGDLVNVEVQRDVAGGLKLYVHVNGVTVLRIGRIDKEVEVTRSDLTDAEAEAVDDLFDRSDWPPKGETLPNGNDLGWDQQA